MNRSLTRLTIVCAVGTALVAAACGTDTVGSPQPAATMSGTSTPLPSTSASTSENAALAALDPCDLLTPADVGQLGLRYPGEAEEVGGANTCRWLKGADGGAAAGIRADQGIDDLNYEGDKVTPTHVGKYPATLVEAPLNAKYMCHVVISVSTSSTVQVIGTVKANSTDTAAACSRATQAAELIAPKLP
ncbi:DUF3558 domain-containing protein [Actinosynnema sp. NPDC004786]